MVAGLKARGTRHLCDLLRLKLTFSFAMKSRIAMHSMLLWIATLRQAHDMPCPRAFRDNDGLAVQPLRGFV